MILHGRRHGARDLPRRRATSTGSCAISVITGLGLGADYGLPPSILADVINSPEGGDTKGKTGTYFGLWALATKLATAIGAARSLPVAALLGFNPGQGPVRQARR